MGEMDCYRVKKIYGKKKIIKVSVPGSKSITNRALLIAALAEGETRLKGALLSKDARNMIDCLRSLGISLEVIEETKEIIVKGCGGKLPKNEGEIYVGNAGTAARFITALLAFSGGRFRVDAGEQMRKRPMKPLIDGLRELGVKIECEGRDGYFPFSLDAGGVKGGRIEMDTTVSSQFLSAVLMTGFLLREGLEVRFSGRTKLPYVEMTVKVMEQFGLFVERGEESYKVSHRTGYEGRVYEIEPDVSAACYFYAMAVLLKCSATVKGVRKNSIQGDIAFVRTLERFGAAILEEKEGLTVVGNQTFYQGVDIDMNAFSDQTMTMAVLALFAAGHTIIRGVSHIRHQESDRLSAIYNEVIRLGARTEMKEDGIIIFPISESDEEVEIETYNDHRMAMAFSLAGLRRGGVIIKNPTCVEKTFKEYFEILDEIVKDEDEDRGSIKLSRL